ncbi:hypothetical protein HAX54_050274, partial [Datura stramonium]|nr:hypothetical protein [Datura stramonium]
MASTAEFRQFCPPLKFSDRCDTELLTETLIRNANLIRGAALLESLVLGVPAAAAPSFFDRLPIFGEKHISLLFTFFSNSEIGKIGSNFVVRGPFHVTPAKRFPWLLMLNHGFFDSSLFYEAQ